MEQKRFGVKNSSIEKLRTFQFALRRTQLTMGFETNAKVFCSREMVEKTVKANTRQLTITPCSPPMEKFTLPRQPPLQQVGEMKTIIIRINDFLDINIEFFTVEDCTRFIRALGDLDPDSRDNSSESDDNHHLNRS